MNKPFILVRNFEIAWLRQQQPGRRDKIIAVWEPEDGNLFSPGVHYLDEANEKYIVDLLLTNQLPLQ